MDTIIEKAFGSAIQLNEKEFLEVTENKQSELFLYVNYPIYS